MPAAAMLSILGMVILRYLQPPCSYRSPDRGLEPNNGVSLRLFLGVYWLSIADFGRGGL
jgi:hypothetical protein